MLVNTKECEPRFSNGKKLEVLDTVVILTRNLMPVCHERRKLKNIQNPESRYISSVVAMSG
jgi:hypothetical protein